MEAVPVCPCSSLTGFAPSLEPDTHVSVAAQVCSGRGVLVAHTWQPNKENFLLSAAKRVARAETPTALSLARYG